MAAVLYVCSAFVVWVCCFKPPVQADNVRCPSSCTCLGNNVDCSSLGLLNIPKDIPIWVTRLELQSNSIMEVQPEDLSRLHKLQYLDLSNNKINAINGSAFKNLIGLQTLKLDSNKLTEIPAFPAPVIITELSLARNHVVTIPMLAMQQMPDLQTMDLSNNFILSITNGSFPAGSKLTHLNLNSNQISVVEQGSLSNLTFLETLKMNKNKVNELPQWVFSQLNSLKTLELMRNKIRSIRGLTFQGLNKLQVLKLRRNSIAHLKDGAFWGVPNLISLQMDHNKIVNVTQAWLFGLEMLKTLSLSHNKISRIEPEAWQPCKHLEKLDLTHNKLTAVTESTLAQLSSLDALLLDHNQISRIDEGAFRDMEELQTLELNSNQIPWTMEDASGAFRGLAGLTKLGLKANAIRSIAAHAFVGLPSLRTLHLEDNDITLIQENAFEVLTDLEDLRFNSSKLFCDCHLAWMPTWLRQNGFQGTAMGTCFHPSVLRGAAIYQVDVGDFKCNNAEFPKPVILESPQSANGFKGENMTLTCTAAITGDSQPRISWKKDHMMMDESLSEMVASSNGDVKRYTSSLRLTDIQDSMAGRYQCVVSNDFGSAFSQRAYISVYVYPVFLKVPKDVTVKAGKPAELRCAATGQPTPVISWQKDGGDNFPAARERRMQVYPNDDRFYIMNTRPADEGIYSCMARNEAGVVVTNATVTVLETPDFVQPMQGRKSTKRGETTVLQCMASGSPQPKLTWLKDDKELVMTQRHFFTADNQILVILNTDWSDAGLYACRMSNSLGTAKGTTELQVLSPSGEAGEAGSSFGLDDESTTTGIIIIAVVCCVVGTSLVWVIIIYHTRKRHEVYSGTPTDETTLPGEAPSSGYMSSEKEGSYSQGTGTVGGYHSQEYQMKESGYESSSGQFRANGYVHPAVPAGDLDEDEKPMTMTAGDRLLRQIKAANSLTSLPYQTSDGDTIGSRQSTSSGHCSGSSDPLSSNSIPPGHSQMYYQLHAATTTSSEDQKNPSSLSHLFPRERFNHPSPLISTDRPHFQTFHPMKPTNHDRLRDCSNGETQNRSWGQTCGRNLDTQEEHWLFTDVGVNQDVGLTHSVKTSRPPITSCSTECSVMSHTHPVEVHKPKSDLFSCCLHRPVDRSGRVKSSSSNICEGVGFNSKRLNRVSVIVHNDSHRHSLSSSSSFHLHSETNSRPVTGGSESKIVHHCEEDSEKSDLPVKSCWSENPLCECNKSAGRWSLPPRQASYPHGSSSSSLWTNTLAPCCCEVVRDAHFCSCQTCDLGQVGDMGLACLACLYERGGGGHTSLRPQQQNCPTWHNAAKSRSGSSTYEDHGCEPILSSVNTGCGSNGCENEAVSELKQPHSCDHLDHLTCTESQNHETAERLQSSSEGAQCQYSSKSSFPSTTVVSDVPLSTIPPSSHNPDLDPSCMDQSVSL